MKNVTRSKEKDCRTVTFREPAKSFRGMIDTFALLEGKDYEGQRHEVLPKSNFRLVFTINTTRPGLVFLGPNSKMRTYPLQDYFVVHFLSGMMPRLGDLKATEMIETSIPLKSVLGTETSTLIDTMQSVRSFEKRQRFIEEFFRRSRLETVFDEGRHIDPVQLIRSSHGRITVSDLAKQSNMTIRTLERIFMEHIGLTPKKFIRLIRFQHALRTLRANGSTNFADLAYSCGYTDQSHLIKEFKSFSKHSPTRI